MINTPLNFSKIVSVFQFVFTFKYLLKCNEISHFGHLFDKKCNQCLEIAPKWKNFAKSDHTEEENVFSPKILFLQEL